MIIWKKFDKDTDLSKIVDLVGMKNDRESNDILVMFKFTGDKKFEPRFASISRHKRLNDIVNIQGITGNVEISHWSEVNVPNEWLTVSDEVSEEIIKQLNNTSPNNKKQ